MHTMQYEQPIVHDHTHTQYNSIQFVYLPPVDFDFDFDCGVKNVCGTENLVLFCFVWNFIV